MAGAAFVSPPLNIHIYICHSPLGPAFLKNYQYLQKKKFLGEQLQPSFFAQKLAPEDRDKVFLSLITAMQLQAAKVVLSAEGLILSA